MSDVLRHVTEEGDRWDLLAWRYYGDPGLYEVILRENVDTIPAPGVFLPAGVAIRIPIVTVEDSPDTGLVPWR